MAWRMLMRRSPNRWMTLVGDTAQTGDPAGSSSWQSALEPYVANRWKLAELTVNYRTPAEIMAVAQDVLRQIDPAQAVPRSIRDAGSAPWARRVPIAEVHAEVRRCVAAETGPGLVAVLATGSDATALRDLRDDRVRVLSVREAKGLEFDVVIVVEPHRIVTASPRGLNDLYVALTRATQRLGVVHGLPLPDSLAKLITAH